MNHGQGSDGAGRVLELFFCGECQALLIMAGLRLFAQGADRHSTLTAEMTRSAGLVLRLCALSN